MKIGFIGGFLGLIFGGMANVALANDSKFVRVPHINSDIPVLNSGPSHGRHVVTTPMRALGPNGSAGAIIGECHTLFYGYTTSQERVEGFSCTKK